MRVVMAIITVILLAPGVVLAQTNIQLPVSAVPDQFLIVPGERIGVMRLGMKLEEVEAMLGPALVGVPMPSSNGSYYYTWRTPDGPPNAQRSVTVDKTHVVISTSVRLDTRYATSDGLRVGLSQEQVASTFVGQWKITYFPGFNAMVYQDKGIIFYVDHPLQIDQVSDIVVCVPQKCS
jgi:hypothetical protein